jgi:RNA polymerase II elongation factor ELL
MATALLPTGGIALLGAPDSDRNTRTTSVQAMQLDMSQEIVDELLESVRSGKPPQIFFGRTPVCVPMFGEACEAVTGWCCCSAA